MTTRQYVDLEIIALRVREHIIRMSGNGGCFIGASLSCADLLVYLYKRVLRLRPDRLDDPERDYLLLSKGHDVPALYGVLAEIGAIPRDRLRRHLNIEDHLYWHPNRNVPGIEFHSGSLGHLLSVAVGICLDVRLRGKRQDVYVVVGDGELDEGSIWEALLVANAQRIENLRILVDRNQFQANVRTEELVPLEPLEDKFRAFGCQVRRCDGHDFRALDAAFETIGPGRHVLIADTVRGKGLPSIEARADRWFVNFTEQEISALLEELHGGARAEIVSAALHVR
jgi:transketolase